MKALQNHGLRQFHLFLQPEVPMVDMLTEGSSDNTVNSRNTPRTYPHGDSSRHLRVIHVQAYFCMCGVGVQTLAPLHFALTNLRN